MDFIVCQLFLSTIFLKIKKMLLCTLFNLFFRTARERNAVKTLTCFVFQKCSVHWKTAWLARGHTAGVRVQCPQACRVPLLLALWWLWRRPTGEGESFVNKQMEGGAPCSHQTCVFSETRIQIKTGTIKTLSPVTCHLGTAQRLSCRPCAVAFSSLCSTVKQKHSDGNRAIARGHLAADRQGCWLLLCSTCACCGAWAREARRGQPALQRARAHRGGPLRPHRPFSWGRFPQAEGHHFITDGIWHERSWNLKVQLYEVTRI